MQKDLEMQGCGGRIGFAARDAKKETRHAGLAVRDAKRSGRCKGAADVQDWRPEMHKNESRHAGLEPNRMNLQEEALRRTGESVGPTCRCGRARCKRHLALNPVEMSLRIVN